MGRPPLGGGPVFRFTPKEVSEMEKYLQESNNLLPAREIMMFLAEKFSASADRAGKVAVQPKQVWNWFQNRRYARKARSSKGSEMTGCSGMPHDDSVSTGNAAPLASAPSGKNSSDESQVEFEAKSSRDGAWYDILAFISYRKSEAGEAEVWVRFLGMGEEEDEWVNVLESVRQRSVPCEPTECAVVLPGDLILCFQEGKEQSLYFDAHVLDAQRRRHDSRGCRCRFLVRYDHDGSEEIVPLRKVCRRPETDYRLKVFHERMAEDQRRNAMARDPSHAGPSNAVNIVPEKLLKQPKLMNVNTEEVIAVPSTSTAAVINSAPEDLGNDAGKNGADEPKEGKSTASG
ncbi:Homeobox domain-containing protein [Dioscorea alata]|uniref:Homeobox domain-containing protein n=1 Tax=Dioscorea alata TaxID=55571 RepID=A0ACB7V612_DIOAL|nr:Homeobox domain-containing protein [Dioscorea alata]